MSTVKHVFNHLNKIKYLTIFKYKAKFSSKVNFKFIFLSKYI